MEAPADLRLVPKMPAVRQSALTAGLVVEASPVGVGFRALPLECQDRGPAGQEMEMNFDASVSVHGTVVSGAAVRDGERIV